MSPVLSIQKLSVTLGGASILSDISLDLGPGQFVTLIGPNGSGKTTLLRATLGAVEFEGRVCWTDRDIASIRERERVGLFAYLPQHPTPLAEHRVGDVIALGRVAHLGSLGFERPADRDIVFDAAKRLDLIDLIDRPMHTLSGGQRQRVYVARCLAQQPRALVLDEPTSFLDLRHQVELLRLLRACTSECGLAVLMACHDLNLAATHCDRLVLMHRGRVARSGAPADVLDPTLLGEVFEVPMRRVDVEGVPQVIATGVASASNSASPTGTSR
jgi:iron complex transport system ATP-binding protein